MAFDSSTRNKLAGMIAEARQLLDKEFTEQFQQIYGIQPDGTIIDIEKLKHLDEQQADTARLLRERIEHLISGMVGEKKPGVIAIERTIREQAFTVLNRFTALRMCEERGFVEECVRQGMQSKGFKVYEAVAGVGLGGTYERYKTFLFCLFDEIAVDLGILFDRFSSEGLLFPREQALVGLLKIINKEDLKNIWVEDETIGWVYQYFNSKEEREAMRKASAAPRNSRELAVRNQFFTPRYVVEFLTDNTLGRIWYEMHRGETVLREVYHYLVHRPNEIFLALGEKAPAGEDHQENLTQEQLLKKPFYVEHRPKKDPRDIRILDPACGSGHFLLYAFDLLETIYLEAWQDPESPESEATGCTLREDYTSQEELCRAIPDLILRWNLHGIDIDPRCVQIASLALWLRAQKGWQKQGLKVDDRPRVTKSNIVTAEPMPGEEDIRREFIQSLEPRVLGQLVDVIFDKMNLAGEAGSLLKIEEEIKEAIAEARKQWGKSPEMEQVALFPHLIKQHPQQEKLRFDVKGITDETFWNQAEERILDSLRYYAERVENGRAVRRRLFAEDAAQGFAFIDLCRKRYDVVLMNPPFGKVTRESDRFVRSSYPDNWKDIYACFLERSSGVVMRRARIGAITSSLFLYSKQLRKLRSNLLERRLLDQLVELGAGVLDTAAVDTALTVQNTECGYDSGLFLDLTQIEDKGEKLIDAVQYNEPLFKSISLSAFKHIFNNPICYHLHPTLLDLWHSGHTLESELAEVVAGNHTFDDERFIRLRNEVPPNELITKWLPYEKGGPFQLFVLLTPLVVNWADGGGEMRASQIKNYGTDAQVVQSISWWFKPGISYPRISCAFGPKILPAGHMFSEKGMCVFPKRGKDRLPLLALLASSWTEALLAAFGRYRAYENSAVANLPYSGGLLTSIQTDLAKIASAAVDVMFENEIGTENSAVFVIPDGVRRMRMRENHDGPFNDTWHSNRRSSLMDMCDVLDSKVGEALLGSAAASSIRIDPKGALVHGIDSLQDLSNSEVAAETLQYFLGCIFGRWDFRLALDRSFTLKVSDPFDPLPVCPPGMLVGSDGLPAESDHIVSEEWLRARPDANTLPPEGAVKNPTIPDSDYPLQISWNGILVDDPGLNESQPHNEDIVRRMREVLDLIWKDRSEAIEHEACQILGVRSLRDYFRKPSGFFQDHLKRYSKSRRQAPIYWPLCTKTGAYTLWVYYHRLTDQTIYTCVNDYVNPKLTDVSKDIERLRREISEGGGTKKRQSLEELMDFEEELKEFRDELLRVAHLPYKPNLNNGVIITAAPLYKLFRHSQWRKDLEEYWRKFESGEYDWAHLAYTIWPDRVREKCKKDRSIAIAHGLEELYEKGSPKDKKQKKKKKA